MIAAAISASGTKTAILREHLEQGKDKKRLIEIWKGDALEAVKDVTKDHGDFYADGKSSAFDLLLSLCLLTRLLFSFFFVPVRNTMFSM